MVIEYKRIDPQLKLDFPQEQREIAFSHPIFDARIAEYGVDVRSETYVKDVLEEMRERHGDNDVDVKRAILILSGRTELYVDGGDTEHTLSFEQEIIRSVFRNTLGEHRRNTLRKYRSREIKSGSGK
ncbi:MAG: hypothetical protein IIA87_04785 [Nanoarchaeota archaeon]|nr:hypothetical protein [Nanoarchaeota archaeon]